MPRRSDFPNDYMTPVRADKPLVAGTDSVFVLPKSVRADRRIMVASFCQIDLKQATGGCFAAVERATDGLRLERERRALCCWSQTGT